MTTRGKRLTAVFVRTVRTPGRYGDGRGGHGLYLRVSERAGGGLAKSWGQRLTIGGKRTNVGIGAFPIVTLAEAREKALENRREVDKGRDPRGGGIPSVKVAAEKVIALKARGWKEGSRLPQQWRSSFEREVFPGIGNKSVAKVTRIDVLSVLTPIWAEKPAAAREVRSRIAAVLDWAMAKDFRHDNPARGSAITAALPGHGGGPKRHHKALHHAEVPSVLGQVREGRGQVSARLALEFVVLTVARSAEAVGARWSEIDFRSATWTIPPSRTKTKREHRVPLSARALEVLREAQSLGHKELVFPSAKGGRMSKTTLQRLARPFGTTVHGFRSSFRDWCAEGNDVSREVAEAALGHVVKNQVEAAYLRSDLLEVRRELMERWSRYIVVS